MFLQDTAQYLHELTVPLVDILGALREMFHTLYKHLLCPGSKMSFSLHKSFLKIVVELRFEERWNEILGMTMSVCRSAQTEISKTIGQIATIFGTYIHGLQRMNPDFFGGLGISLGTTMRLTFMVLPLLNCCQTSLSHLRKCPPVCTLLIKMGLLGFLCSMDDKQSEVIAAQHTILMGNGLM